MAVWALVFVSGSNPVRAQEANQDVWDAIRATLREPASASALVPSPLSVLDEPLYSFAADYHAAHKTRPRTTATTRDDANEPKTVSHVDASSVVVSPLVAPVLD